MGRGVFFIFILVDKRSGCAIGGPLWSPCSRLNIGAD